MAEKKSGFSIRRLIFNDKYLIITSLLLALLVWVVTSLNIGSDESKTIKINVPIKLGDEVSEQLGMQYYTLQDTIELDVTVTGAKYAVGQVKESDLSVKFDTSNVNRTGEQNIPILVTKSTKKLDFTVASIYPSSLDAYFDVNEAKTLPLYLQYNESAVADGYTFGEPVLSEDKIIVSGPKTYVDKIDRVYVDANLSSSDKLTEPFSAECAISVEGAGVEASYLTFAARGEPKTPITTVSVTLPVLKVSELPVTVSIDDKPSGFNDDDLRITYSDTALRAGVLQSTSIKQALIGTVSFSELQPGKNRFTFDVTNLEGITTLDNDVQNVDVIILLANNYTAKTVKLDTTKIKFTGVKDGKSATLSDVSSRTVTVYLPKENANDAISLEVKCDLNEDGKSGTYPLTFTVKGNSSAWVYGTYNADVTVK